MKVQIENNLYLESDDRQFILKEYTGKIRENKGKEVKEYRTHGYFSSFESVLKKLLKMKIMSSNAKTIAELLSEHRETRTYIETQYKKLTAYKAENHL